MMIHDGRHPRGGKEGGGRQGQQTALTLQGIMVFADVL